ncbi:hypothetical protein PSN45_005117 [Yamadazyma tenuis]|uniref:PIG-U-domain-containing protein n=1 Tax=Candida tenuis (strain ATCC 10573 / BCRC 21748 / CBS 615 / JCM 9827 / NBRC 10315 / NRRL Y-1498 / VKM Y-70) TaxID=590646 RepID=G3B2V4_CANTC|nr:PIG-U-domain-containing protein [Yamadazyma tenuis ATCC 10573]EGV64768.1 PIG-U-domain-containing protein [Yamadazyma tenuis ATCC 10573]WEJ97561.1 hypothetical protein PSN45_005117 [Yamadazyma tenuis]
MNQTHRILCIGVLVRFLLPTLFPSIPFKLSTVVELATPINSYTSLQEAFFYLQHSINPYDGGVNHHPPLLVAFFGLFKSQLPDSVFLTACNLLYSVVDVIIALRLASLNRWYNARVSKKTGEPVAPLSDALMVSFYLFNPLIILTNLSHCTLVFSQLFIIESLHQLTSNTNLARAMVSLGIATYLSGSPVLMVVPVLALAYVSLPKHKWENVYIQGTVVFFMTCGLLVFISAIWTSSVAFLDQCYGVIIRFDKIQPNVGLWWYFFTEMFDFFTPFYIGVFNLFSMIFIVPLTIRFFEYEDKDPKKASVKTGDAFLAVYLCYVWMSFLKSYPTVGDFGLAISLAPIFAATVLPYCKLVYITALTLLVCLILSPIFYYCWIVLGNGNSNFFYSINLVWGGVHILVLIDFTWGQLIREYCQEHDISPEQRHVIRLTQL